MKKKSTPRVFIPISPGEADKLLGQIGKDKVALDKMMIARNEAIQKTEQPYNRKAMKLAEGIEAKIQSLSEYAKENREELTDSGRRKTVTGPSGSYGWRERPPSVSISRRYKTEVIGKLKKIYADSVKVKEEIDREAILRKPDIIENVKGIEIKKGREDFFAKPNATKIEVSPEVAKLKKALK